MIPYFLTYPDTCLTNGSIRLFPNNLIHHVKKSQFFPLYVQDKQIFKNPPYLNHSYWILDRSPSWLLRLGTTATDEDLTENSHWLTVMMLSHGIQIETRKDICNSITRKQPQGRGILYRTTFLYLLHDADNLGEILSLVSIKHSKGYHDVKWFFILLIFFFV